MKIFFHLVVDLGLFCFGSFAIKFSCKSDGGNSNVDWFIVLKLPKLPKSKIETIKEGIRYAYMDSNSTTFKLSPYTIESSEGALGATLSTVYNETHSPYHNTFAYVFYNDQPPEYDPSKVKKKPSNDYGHSKGAIAFDLDGGFWLVHSAPKFPHPVKFSYSYPDNAKKFGQSFICLTLPGLRTNRTIDDIATHLRYIQPFTYDFNLPSQWRRKELENFDALLGNNDVKVKIFQKSGSVSSYLKQSHETFDRFEFTTFGKNRIDLDLIQLIAKEFGPLFAETWRGRNSGDVKVTVVEKIELLRRVYLSNNDHSKYLISKPSKKRYICIGDINREVSQNKRGGGYVCIFDVTLWKEFYKIIHSFKVAY